MSDRLKNDSLRGWKIHVFTLHGKPHWKAIRQGVSMNTNTYGGILKMILNKPHLVRSTTNN